MISSIIKPGCKVDIRMLQQVKREQETGQVAQIFKSKICDVDKAGKIQLYMPMDGSKYILLPLDLRYEFVFYTENGLYRCEGKVTERFKTNNIYMIAITITTQPSKFQRREYYRYECLMDLRYTMLTKEQAELPDLGQIKVALEENPVEEKTGFIMDISGGGIRFVSKEKYERGDCLLMFIKLNNTKFNKEYGMVGAIIQSDLLDTTTEKYQNRVQFMIKDVKVREEIIQFIFEEERRNRHKKG